MTAGKPVEVSDADRRAHTEVVDSEDAPSRYGERPVTEVAVGVLVDAQGRFLLTSRPAGKVYAGYWEFPGGKLEPGETVEQALRRELHEEIGITIGPALPWQVLMMDYPHARVRLNFCKVFEWTGRFEMREGQHMAWERLPVASGPVLPGTIPVLEWFAQEQGFRGPTHRG
jgi:8-oxo-dGTP diphosphatase